MNVTVYVIQPHRAITDAVRPLLASDAVFDECGASEWVCVYPDGTWTGPYRSSDDALDARRPVP